MSSVFRACRARALWPRSRTGAEHVFGDGAGFEGVHVALDGGFGLFQLSFGGGELVLVELGDVGSVASLGGDGSFEEFGVGIDGQEGGEDGLFEDVGADAFAGAGVFAVTLAGPAGVVAVAVSFAASGRADVVAVAVPASDEAGEEVIGVLVGEAAVVAFAAFGEQRLGFVEQHGIDERFVGLVAHVAEGDFAEVAAVAEDAEDDLGGEPTAGAGAVPVVVQFGGDGERAGSFGAVAGEDAFDDGELGRFDGEVVVVVEA